MCTSASRTVLATVRVRGRSGSPKRLVAAARAGHATRVLRIAPAFTVLALLLPSSAGAYLYWVGEHGLDRVNLNGTRLEEPFIPSPNHGRLHGFAVTQRYVFFGRAGGLVGRAAIDGQSVLPDFAAIPQPPPFYPEAELTEVDAASLAASRAYVYWSSGGAPLPKEKTDDSIGRISVATGRVEPGFIETGAPVYGVTTYDGHLYWASARALSRANLNGGELDPELVRVGEIYGLAVADNHIYWTIEHAIARADLDGRDINLHFITGSRFFSGIAVSGKYIYWLESKEHELPAPSPIPASIARANLNGGGVRHNWIKVTGFAGVLEADELGPGAALTASHPQRNRTSDKARR